MLYFKLMGGLYKVGIEINCKVLVDLVVNYLEVFKVVVVKVKVV